MQVLEHRIIFSKIQYFCRLLCGILDSLYQDICMLQKTVLAYRQLRARRALSIFKDVPLRTTRALSIFKDVPLRTRRALSPYKVYGYNALLVLNGTSLKSGSALLALKWRYFMYDFPNGNILAFTINF